MENKNYNISYENPNNDRPSDFYSNSDKIFDEVMQKDKPNLNKIERFFQKWKMYPDVWTWYYQALLKNSRNVEARKCLDKILDLFPDYFYGKLSLALAHIKEGEFEKAKEIMGKTPDISLMMPGKSEFYYEDVLKYYAVYVDIELALDNDNAADEILKKAIDVTGNEKHKAIGMIQRSILRYRMNRFSKKLERSDAIKLEPNFLDTNDYVNYESTPFIHPEIQSLCYEIYVPEKEDIDEILSLPRESLIKDLGNIIQKTIYEKNSSEEFDYNAVASTIYFLTELKATESLPVVMQILRQDSEYYDFWFGDLIRKICAQLFYYIALEHPEELIAFLKEPNRYSYFKSFLLEAFEGIAIIYPERRAEVLTYYKEILDFYYQEKDNQNIIDTHVNSNFECSILDLGFKELLPVLEKFHQENLIDEMYCGNIEDVRVAFEKDTPKTEFELLTIYEFFEREKEWRKPATSNYMDDRKNELDGIFNEQFDADYDEEETYVRTEPKIGRNDPCPCGSGKKYKKCCGK